MNKYFFLLSFLCVDAIADETANNRSFSEKTEFNFDADSIKSMEEVMRKMLVETCVDQFCEKFKISEKLKKEKQLELTAFASDLIKAHDAVSVLAYDMAIHLFNQKLTFPKVNNKEVFFKILETEVAKSSFNNDVKALKKESKESWDLHKKTLKGVVDFSAFLVEQKKGIEKIKKEIFEQYSVFIKEQAELTEEDKIDFAHQVITAALSSICTKALE